MALAAAAASWRQVGGRFREALVMAWRAMAANKMRTALTMLGIIIGIASVVSILVIGDAAKQMVLADIKSIGTNTVDIYPGKDFGDDDPTYRQSLKYGDLDALREQPYISALSPSISSSMRLRLGNVDAAANVNGVSEQFFRVRHELYPGRRHRSAAGAVAGADGSDRRQYPAAAVPAPEERGGRGDPGRQHAGDAVGVAKEKQSMFGSSKTLNVGALQHHGQPADGQQLF